MIDVREAAPGDVIWFKVPWQKRPLYGEIVRTLPREDAVQVLSQNSGYRVVWAPNAFHDEKVAKKAEYKKYVKPQNTYLHDDLDKEASDEKSDDRECAVHNRKEEQPESKRTSGAGQRVQRRVKRKQATVRSTKRRKK